MLIDYVDLRDWKKKKEILSELFENYGKVDERTWRLYVAEYNTRFWEHEVDTFIVHSAKGYKLTNDKDEICNSLGDMKKRSLNMLWKYSRTMKALGEKDNIMLDLKEMEIM